MLLPFNHERFTLTTSFQDESTIVEILPGHRREQWCKRYQDYSKMGIHDHFANEMSQALPIKSHPIQS